MELSGWGRYPKIFANISLPRTYAEVGNLVTNMPRGIARGLGRSYGDSSLAKEIIENSEYKNWTLDNNVKANEIYIDVQRIENVSGTHSIFYTSEVDTIEIIHTAHSRDGFALGSIIAAEWLVGKKGVFTMKDVLELN